MASKCYRVSMETSSIGWDVLERVVLDDIECSPRHVCITESVNVN
jgi:hypothetical protein